MEESPTKSKVAVDMNGIHYISEFLLFIKFFGTPKQFRKEIFGFDTETQFTEKYNLSRDTVVDWKKRNGFHEAIMQETYKFCKHKTPEVIGAMLDKIRRNGDKQEVEFWFRLFEDYRDVNDINLISDIDKRTDNFRKILESWQNNENDGGDKIDTSAGTAQALRDRLEVCIPSA
jgi:hypothetical protein